MLMLRFLGVIHEGALGGGLEGKGRRSKEFVVRVWRIIGGWEELKQFRCQKPEK